VSDAPRGARRCWATPRAGGSPAADALRYAVTGFRPQQEVAPGARRARTNYDFFGGN